MIINYFSPILQDILLLVCVCLSAHTESVLAILRLPVPKLACFLYPSPPLASSSNFSFTHCHNWIPYCVILAIIYTWLPPHSYFLLCIIQKCFSEHTHASAHTHTHTHPFQITKHTPRVRWMQCRTTNILRRCCHYCIAKTKKTLTHWQTTAG